MEIRAILFDATGTLIHLPKGVGHYYAEAAGEFGLELDPGALDHAFLAVWRELPPPPNGPRPDDDKGWWREVVRQVLERCDAHPLDFNGYFETVYRRFVQPGVWDVFPEVRQVLERLHGRYRLAVVSNFDGRLRSVLQHLELSHFFDAVVISSEVGADKPDPAVFHAACRMLGVTPPQALHVGDDPERDWTGAEEAGLHVFRLNRAQGSLVGLLAFLNPAVSAKSGG